MRFKDYIIKKLSKLFLRLYRLNTAEIERLQKMEVCRQLGYLAPSAVLHFPLHMAPPQNVFIHDNVNIAPFVQIWANARVTIKKDTLIASHVIITSSTHDYTVAPIRSKRIDLPVTIGEDVWIGSGAIIFPGVNIGDGAVIGAGSVVKTDVEPLGIYVGMPAKKIGTRANGSSK